jgi:hypothetical protein
MPNQQWRIKKTKQINQLKITELNQLSAAKS